MQWYIDVIKKYAVFVGRARRKEFWMFMLFNAIVAIALGLLDNAIGTDFDGGSGRVTGGWLWSIYYLAILLPLIGVAIRRLHDTNRSGWWMLLYLTCIGIIVLIVFWAEEGNAGANQYGPDPKAAERFGQPGAGPAEPGYPTV